MNSKTILVRFEGFQTNGQKTKFPLFTVLKYRLHKGSDGTYYSVYEPNTTIGAKALRQNYNVWMPDKFDRKIAVGTILELIVHEPRLEVA